MASNRKEGSSIRTLLKRPKVVFAASSQMDKYTAGIELSNACRQFYVTRLKAAGKVKDRLGLSNGINREQEECTENTGDETKHTYEHAGKASSSRQLSAGSAEQQKPIKHGKIESAMATLKYEMVRSVWKCNFINLNQQTPNTRNFLF